MISIRYHFFTVISIFLALGIGVLLGGSLGQQWLSEKQQTLFGQLEHHYDIQLQKNKRLTNEYSNIMQAYQQERDKTDDLLRLTVGGSLADRYFIVFSSDNERASRLQKMIQWAGGQAQVRESLTYSPAEVDGVILFGDGWTDRVNTDVLKDLRLLYRAPVVVYMEEPEAVGDEHAPWIYKFNEPLSESLSEYRFLRYLQQVTPLSKEAGADHETSDLCHYSRIQRG